MQFGGKTHNKTKGVKYAFCKKCGCYLEDNCNCCPSCGEVVTKKQPESIIEEDKNKERGPWKGFAIASLPSSIVGLIIIFMPYLSIYGFITVNVALVLAILGLKSKKSHGLALAGLIISCVALAIIFILVVSCVTCIHIIVRDGCSSVY